MAGTAVSTVVRETQAVMRLTTKNIDFDMLSKYAEKLRGGGRMPGTLLTYSLGEYILGFGKDKKKRKHPIEAVANVPNLMFAWRKFADGKMEMPCFCYPLIGESLPPRSEMGDHDEDLWDVRKKANGKPELDDDGNVQPIDPWQQVAILMLRVEKTGELLRFETSSMSGKGAIVDLITAYAEQAKRNSDKLPVIVMDSEKRTQKGTTNKYDAPVFEIIDWSEPTDADFPEGGVSLTAEADEVSDAGKGKAQSRGAKKAAAEEEEPKRGRKVTRQADEDEEEEPAPRRGRKAAAVEEEEEEDEPSPRRGRRPAVEEDDEEEPAPRRSARRARDEDEEEEPAPRRGRKAAAAEDDEEDEPAPARTRRRVMAG